mmetsp:Transcript_90446/g.189174  ORF Transcript_90446/g.189174 Transcript_90446/m.189174 type:complete len:416 (-) Transcript_90446:90-1337(-)|eukprot:CAMPEP_0206435250 /NCGR_PEP_ID=MMETSP0324_2-20121206/9718_1 /ASSEMBLY_ACC=CAM_ASM_000836 /TAXON_ID=2866 /ORGANISM="Crypthecodinium cohnii, Strain Seligo" /LENGTH=415 /DNA_ID=CAMNT_0053902073 /DNA_START=114 /DNA_END=1361 /DNA_ORIENTATION=+
MTEDGQVKRSSSEAREEQQDQQQQQQSPVQEGGMQEEQEQPAKKARVMPKAPRELSNEEFQAWADEALRKTQQEVQPTEAVQPPVDGSDDAHEELPEAFKNFKFTGPLRPGRVTPQMRPPSGADLPDYAKHKEGVSMAELKMEMRAKNRIPIVEGDDLATMREVCRLGREVLDVAGRFLRAGVTGDEVDRIVWQACEDRGLYPSPLNYFKFPKSVCVSANEVICHGIPDSRRVESGDIINLDVSVFKDGFHSDLNETFLIGNVDEASLALVDASYEALRCSTEIIKPGTMYRDLGAKIQDYAESKGFKLATAFAGHGVGKLFHGPPTIPHHKKNKAVGIMKKGHIFTVEPMLVAGTRGKEKMWPDDWTAVAITGQRSAQFEHTFLVTDTGFEVLTARPGDPTDRMPPFDAKRYQC